MVIPIITTSEIHENKTNIISLFNLIRKYQLYKTKHNTGRLQCYIFIL